MFNPKENIQVNLLKQVKEVLDKHNIKFWLDGGNLLAVARDGKFLLWDPDVDLSVWREDVPRNLEILVANELKNRGFEVRISENNLHVHVPGEQIHADLSYNHLWIDKAIKPWINRPVRLLDRGLYYLLSILSNPFDYESDVRTISFTKKLIKIGLFKISRGLPSFSRKHLARIIKVIYEKTKATNIAEVVPIKYFTDFATVSFYGMEVRVPAKTEEYLAYKYGEDWKTPRKDWITRKSDRTLHILKGKFAKPLYKR